MENLVRAFISIVDLFCIATKDTIQRWATVWLFVKKLDFGHNQLEIIKLKIPTKL